MEIKLTCQQVIKRTKDAKTYLFKADENKAFQFNPGQYLTLTVNIAAKFVARNYSISSIPDEYSDSSYFAITVKRIDQGLVSNWLFDEMKTGMQLISSTPMGEFCLNETETKDILLLSAGGGITPMLSMISHHTAIKSNLNIKLFHSERTLEEVIGHDTIKHCDAINNNFDYSILLTGHDKHLPSSQSNRISHDFLMKIDEDYLNRKIYVCGPQGYRESVKEILLAYNFSFANYYEESFTPATIDKKIDAYTVEFEGETIKDVDGGLSILEGLETKGVDVPHLCRAGNCGCCKIQLLKGQACCHKKEILSDYELENGVILACSSQALSDISVETY